MERDAKGRFKYTGKTSSSYFFGKNGHRAIWEAKMGPIPKGYVIHHIDKNRFNNDIDNLALCSVVGHGRIHAHTAWNKGIPLNEDTKQKIHSKRSKTIMNRWEEWAKLKDSGMTYIQIGEKVGKCREQVSSGVRRFKATRGDL